MRVLTRVAVTLVIAIPACLVLVIVFALTAKRAASLCSASGDSRSPQTRAAVGSSLPARDTALSR
jgi:hypothetical protein